MHFFRYDFQTFQVIQRRLDGTVNFDVGWDAYKVGFGFLGSEFWLGNENIHYITNQKDYELRVETKRYDGSSHVSHYNYFRVAEESRSYRLSTRTYTGHEGKQSLMNAHFLSRFMVKIAIYFQIREPYIEITKLYPR